MSDPRLLDLFCGAGGAAMGYSRAGFEVVGVDIKPQPHYPFEFHQADALEYVAEHGREFDAIHASPPCQRWTAYARRPAHVGEYPDLIGRTRRWIDGQTRSISWPKPYVIENVRGAPLRSSLMLCGSAFGLDVRRHRYFESGALLPGAPDCNHSAQAPRFPQATNRANLRRTVEVGVWRIPLETQKRAMGVDWNVELEELSEMVPPAYTEWIGRQLIAALESVA